MRPMLHHPRRFAQSGFTLVEMAIVLVIVGLLLGGVLKGQEMIENARVKDAANMINGITAAYNSYIDRYGRLPGDDGPTPQALQARGGRWANASFGGNMNGVIDTPSLGEIFNGTWESVNFFLHLRSGGFLKGDETLYGVAGLPKHPWGGPVSVTSLPTHNRGGFILVMCMQNVPSKGAAALDRLIDDGLPGSGTMRANAGLDVGPTDGFVNTGQYQVGWVYTICQEI